MTTVVAKGRAKGIVVRTGTQTEVWSGFQYLMYMMVVG